MEPIFCIFFVKEEVLDSSAPEYPLLQSAFSKWLIVSDVPKSLLATKLGEMGLHLGETDALALAYHTKEQKSDSVIIIDDLAARDVARALGLRLTGTIGIILRATKEGLLSKTESLTKINFLVEQTSFRISTTLYSRIISELK